MSSLAPVEHRNQDATVYVGNLDTSCTENMLMELFVQVGRVKSVYMVRNRIAFHLIPIHKADDNFVQPKDKVTQAHNGYGFVEFLDVIDADYAITIMNMIKVYGRPLKVSKSSLNNKAELSRDVGANLFIGNLDTVDVDENLLYDTFSSFGTLIRQPRIMRDEATNESKGFGFVSFDCFESSDNAIECMNGQFLGNRQIVVQYAFKKDTAGEFTESAGRPSGSSQERHGSRAERMLAAQRRSQQQQQHHIKMPPLPGASFNPLHTVLPGIHTIPPPPPPTGIPPPPPAPLPPVSSSRPHHLPQTSFPPPPPPPPR